MSIVITGNPGTGKHTIADKIKDVINLPVLDINEFANECGLLEKKDDTNDVDTEKLAKKLQEKITSPHIIVGHLAPYSVSDIPINV
ncbi:MAG: shikimate kinase, partial [Nitrosopumilaceae archaeon]|nr:shikimate kinase [Nitrosopumilaceae archaeon]NIU02211.1 shikimate kinase [Nitrosopumilaceae archaeon]NIU86140.1 shikimate kinase [Nitrosopumilaceae archaeon]NIV64939.1 shikimate kinase [Nitrosopumilaceae archaeon]NIX62812.1 shikimate kinase [Nitrosopumilaceae archaeon]